MRRFFSMHSSRSTRTPSREWRRDFLSFCFLIFVLTAEVRAGIRIRGDAAQRISDYQADIQTRSAGNDVASASSLLLRRDSSTPAYQVLSAASSSVQPPQILSQPQDVQVQSPGEITLAVRADSAGGALSYLWYKDGVSTGVKTRTLTVSVRVGSGLGAYKCKVSNSKYAVFSRSALVSWAGVSAPVINVQPVGGAKPVGSVASLSVDASGVGLSYQWRKGGVIIAGATDPILHVVVREALAKYDCEILAGGFTKITSAAATVSSLASSYAGVETSNADLNSSRGALVQVAVTNAGVVTGKIVSIAGTSTFKGSLQVADGKASIVGATSKGDVVQLALSDDGEVLSGTVAKAGSSVPIEMKRCSWTDPGASMAGIAGVYNVALEPIEGLLTQPRGSGWSSVGISKKGGVVALAGSLADGTVVSLSTLISGTGEIPVFCALYGGKGSLVGNLAVPPGGSSPEGKLVDGSLVWSKGTDVAPKAGPVVAYPAGFDALSLKVGGGYYVAQPKGTLFLGAGASVGGAANVHLALIEETLAVDVAADAIFTGAGASNSVRFVSNPASVKIGTIDLKTGIVKGTFAVSGQSAGAIKASTFSGLAVPQGGNLVAKGYALIPKSDAVAGKTNLSERVSGTMEMTVPGR